MKYKKYQKVPKVVNKKPKVWGEKIQKQTKIYEK